MPLSKYDREFGGKGGAAKAHAAMKETYGEKKGESVFYALKNKRKKMKAGGQAKALAGALLLALMAPLLFAQSHILIRPGDVLVRPGDVQEVALWPGGPAGGTPPAPPPSTLLTDLVSAWPLSADGSDAHGANDLTNNNGVTFVPLGPSGVVALANLAASEYLSGASFPISSGDFTLTFWWKSANVSNVAVFGFSSGLDKWYLVSNANSMGVVLNDTVAGQVNAAVTPTDNTWNLVEFYYDESVRTGTLSLNGRVTSSTTAALANGLKYGGGTEFQFFQSGGFNSSGHMSDAGLWTGIISSGVSTTLFNAGKGKSYADLTTAEKVGLVSYWNLDEVSGNRADSHGSNTLTDNNTVGSATNSYPANMPGTVANFVGSSSQYFSVADSATTVWGEDGNGVSLSFWVRPSANPVGFAALFVRNDLSSDTQRNFNAFTDVTDIYIEFNAGARIQSAASGLTIGTWDNIIVTFDPADQIQRLYKNNVLEITSAAGASGTLASPTSAVAIGGWTALSGFLNGNMTEVDIWSRVLTPTERACLYSAGAGGFYPFDELCN